MQRAAWLWGCGRRRRTEKGGPRCSGRLGSGVAEVREPVCSFAELEAQEAVRIEVRHTFVHIAAVAPSRRCQSLPVDGLSAAE